MTKEEVVKLLIDNYGKPFEENGEMWQAVLASLPDGYGGKDKGYSFLQGCMSLNTGKLATNIFLLHVDENGKYSPWNYPLSENQLNKFIIDWDARTVVIKEQIQ